MWRKRYGAGMRQAGVLAAAGLYALDHHIERLADDHGRARRFAAAVAEVAPGVVDPGGVETNIVMLDVAAHRVDPRAAVAALGERSVRVYAVDSRRLRCVWHLDVDDAATDLAVAAVRELLGH